MKNKIRFLIPVILMALAMSACAGLPAPPLAADEQASALESSPVALKVCFSSISANMSPLQYAVDHGIFAKYDLAPELIYIDSGTTAIQSMIAGDFDLCMVAGSSVINAVAAGEDLRVIAGLVNKYTYTLVGGKEIKTAEDLRGGAVAVSSYGSSSDTAVREALRRLGLEPDVDVTILAIGGQGDRLAALASGGVQATVITPPQTLVAYDMGFVPLIDFAQLDIPYLHTTIAARGELVDSSPEIAIAFTKATLEAIDQMQNDPQGSKQVLAEFLDYDMVEDGPVLDETYNTSIKIYVNSGPYPTMDGIQSMIDGLVSDNPAAANITAEDVVDLSILDAIKAEGFFENLGQ